MDERDHSKRKAIKVVEKTAQTTIRVTATIVKVIFILIIIFTIFVTIWQYFFVDREQFLSTIAAVSVGGFWAFFLGYFGWRMGQTIELYFHNLKKKK
jgi:hypothetical protein